MHEEWDEKGACLFRDPPAQDWWQGSDGVWLVDLEFTIESSTCATIRFCDLIVARLSEILSGYVAALLHVADHSAQQRPKQQPREVYLLTSDHHASVVCKSGTSKSKIKETQ